MRLEEARRRFQACVLALAGLAGTAPVAAAPMLVRSGSYTGDGMDGRAVYVGFRPDFVIVKRDQGSGSGDPNFPVARTSTMVGDSTKHLHFSGVGNFAGGIKSLDSTGFTLGTHANVNGNGAPFYWMAFKAAAGEMKVGSYVGTNANNRSIAGVGFQPDYVLILPQAAQPAVHRSSAMPGELTFGVDSLIYATNNIKALQADGFVVGTDAKVNQGNPGAVTYHYVAWKAVPGRMGVGQYTGNGTTLDVDTVGFQPELVMVRKTSTSRAWVLKPGATGVNNDYVIFLNDYVGSPVDIPQLRPLGFRVTFGLEGAGNDRVNDNGATYYWVAFGPHPPTTNYRSIGTAANYAAGSIAVTNGSITVTGSGTTWRAANRGRGDRIFINGTSYVVAAVVSDTLLRLTAPFAGATASYSSPNYYIARQFSTLAAWEDCLDGLANGGSCPVAAPASASLVADDRSEVGIAYKDSPFVLPSDLAIQGATTDVTHTITLTADVGNRHLGTPGAGVIVDQGTTPGIEILVQDSNVTIEWLEIVNTKGNLVGSVRVLALAGDKAANVLLQNLLVHGFADAGSADTAAFMLSGDPVPAGDKSVTIRNAMVWAGDSYGFWGDEPGDTAVIESCSFDGMLKNGVLADRSAVTVRNTIVTSSGTGDFAVSAGSFTGSNNTSSDATAATWFASPLTGVAASSVFLAPGSNLHLRSGANGQVNTGIDLSASFAVAVDVDNHLRPAGAWDRGADERDPTTLVTLSGFRARPLDGAVALAWETASELGNLGFHVYRATSGEGPWTRITASLIPGLGSSGVGRAYSHLDSGLANGVTYYYRLEDTDASAVVTSHGPVSATPTSATPPARGPGGGGGGSSESECPPWVLAAYASAGGVAPSGDSGQCARYGNPDAVTLRVVSRTTLAAVLELRTGGFYGFLAPGGRVRVFVPGFDLPQEGAPRALPHRRALVDVVAGRRVALGLVQAADVVAYPGVVPDDLGPSEMQISPDGTVRPGRAELRPAGRDTANRAGGALATLLPSVFQGRAKSTVVLLSPFRLARRGGLTLARTLRVELRFDGLEPGETTAGGARRTPSPGVPSSGRVLRRLFTTRTGLHAVAFERLFGDGRLRLPVAALRLERGGETVSFHVEPASRVFGPGSVLYFHADRAAASTDFSPEIAYELARARDGRQMPSRPAAPSGAAALSGPRGHAAFETNRFYQPGLLEAPDPWLWESCAGGATRTVGFTLEGLDPASPDDAEVELMLQGASESGVVTDHHVRVSVNGVLAGEETFAGKRPHVLRLTLPAAALREGPNELAVTNVGDTGVPSVFHLDRLSVRYGRQPAATAGVLEGTWRVSGAVGVHGLPEGAAVLDLTGAVAGGEGPAWLTGSAVGGEFRFEAEAGHRYLLVAPSALITPRVSVPSPPTLRSRANRADYVLIAPRAFLPAAAPLLRARQDQGLTARGVSLEDVAEEFGHGRPSAEAVRSFLSFAFHSWRRPSPRYVLLLGDSTYDPQDFMRTGKPSPLPALWTRTSYLWTVSDPLLAAVNGADRLPDLAIGRLPAGSPGEAAALVDKLLARESSLAGLSGAAALVADNPDTGGDFEADVDDIAASYLLDGRPATLLRVSELGPGTRDAVRDALDSGLDLLSYVGHGGAAVWASENVWNSWDAATLRAQSQQPLLVTMNCLNGYFVAPTVDSLAESLVKVEGRGAVAAFSPSGLSLDGPAHEYHRALMAEVTSGRHERLGDAVFAAQEEYARRGLMPELLSVYHLLGDPATPLR